MRTFPVFACVLMSGFWSSQAFADAQSYCEVFGKDFANGKTSDVDQWLNNYRNAFGDCVAQYSPDAKVEVTEKEIVKKIVVVPARDFSRKKRIPILAPGSIAWNNYCASKYNSFNPVTGNYRSHSGQQKPCLTPSD